MPSPSSSSLPHVAPAVPAVVVVRLTRVAARHPRHDDYSDGSIRPGLEEDFLMQMAEFLGAFMEANLGRVLGMGEAVV